MMKEELVSIIMPSYNGEDFISDSIKSVLAQTYQNWELLISDDKSTDGTTDIIQSYVEKDTRIKFFPSKQNFGPAVTRNRSIQNAKGRYIAFLDSDDLWVPEKLETQIAFMRDRNAALSYGHYDMIYENGQFAKPAKKLKKTINYDDLLKNQIIGCLTAIYDTKQCGKVKMPVIRKRQDFALWLRILKQGHIAHCYPEVIGHYRIRKNSVSSNKLKAMTFNWRMYRTVEKLSVPKSSYVFGLHMLNKIFR